MTKIKTSWGGVAKEYTKVIEKEDSYQKKVIQPNLLRILGDISNKNILDVACGEGYFADLLYKKAKKIEAFDISSELIEIAKQRNKNINFQVLDAQNFACYYKEKFDIVFCILAIQNIENFKKVLENVKEVLKDNGKFVIVLNHPVLRIPKYTSWGIFNNLQYRRVDKYMSEDKIKIDMTPGKNKDKKYTYSYHRPLQYYFKIIKNLNMKVINLEEWISHKISQENSKHKEREDSARKEIPMFMCIEIIN